MTLRHLNIFVNVVNEGSMTAAAKKLFIAQPSVSQAISELESYYQVALFERIGKKLYLTEAGNKLLTYAVHIINLIEEAHREITEVKSISARVGASVTVGTYVLFNIIKTFQEEHPLVKIHPIVDNTTEIEKMLLHNEIDIGLVEGEIRSRDLITAPFMEDELVLICPKSHPWAQAKKIKAEELNKADFIVREIGSGTRELFESILKAKGIEWNNIAVLNNAESIKNAVIAGIGVAVISRIAVARELKQQELAVVDIVDLKFRRKFHIVYHKNKYISEAMKYLIEICSNTSKI